MKDLFGAIRLCNLGVRRCAALFSGAMLLFFSPNTLSVELPAKQQYGETITSANAVPAKRVISLSPSTTELAYAAGMGDVLIAASAYSDYPPEAQRLEKVADWQGINVERILKLRPDLILAWRGGNPQRQLDQLAAFGIPIYYADAKTTEQLADSLDQLANYSPHPQQAHQQARALRQHQAELQQRYSHAQPVRVFLQFGQTPLFSSSGDTLQSQIVTLCGGVNIFADSRVPWPQVSREQVLKRQPQVILVSGHSDQSKIIQAFWQPYLNVPVITLNEDWFNRASPRIFLAAEQLCQVLASLHTAKVLQTSPVLHTSSLLQTTYVVEPP